MRQLWKIFEADRSRPSVLRDSGVEFDKGFRDEGVELLKIEYDDAIAGELGYNLQVDDY